jgi:pimeloyl-ACP methyl ester carboxylesterase
MKKKFFIIIITIFGFFFISLSPANAEEMIELQTRPGVRQRFILIKPAHSVATVILFAGGDGNLKLSSRSGTPVIGRLENNFLVRSRHLFAEHGFTVAVIDSPSDAPDGMLYGLRTSQEHVIDIEHVIDYLKKQAKKPVWLIGTSRGTESAAYIAVNSGRSIDGLVLTSSITEDTAKGTSVTSMELHKIIVPTLIVAHRNDNCRVTPPEGTREIFKLLTRSPKKEILFFEGGDKPISANPCRALSYHGFLGIEKEVVSAIAGWIKTSS